MNTLERRMLDLLVEGRDRHGILAVKAEFEAEGTRHDELLRLLEIARRAGVGVAIKIGGCEAIRDLIECRQFGVDYVIAPMVETPYALGKYVAARDKVFAADERCDTRFLFNVETVTTYHNLVPMAEIAGAADIGMVFGRVDFAGSLGQERAFINSAEMTGYVSAVAMMAAAKGVDMVVGGGVSAEAVPALRDIRRTKLDRFETRKVIFDAAVVGDGRVDAGLALAIDFELSWLKNKRDYYRSLSAEDETRIAMIESRRPAAPAVRAAA